MWSNITREYRRIKLCMLAPVCPQYVAFFIFLSAYEIEIGVTPTMRIRQVMFITYMWCYWHMEWSKKLYPSFNFAITSANFADFNYFSLFYNTKFMAHKSKITPATSPLFCNRTT